jgi:hypothetical protein
MTVNNEGQLIVAPPGEWEVLFRRLLGSLFMARTSVISVYRVVILGHLVFSKPGTVKVSLSDTIPITSTACSKKKTCLVTQNLFFAEKRS